MPDPECFDENTVVAFLRGQLNEQQSVDVDRHLDGCVECRALLIAMAKAESRIEGSTRGISFGAPFLQGAARKIQRYHLLERIGAGAMGLVYAAYDPQLNRKIAIKVLRRDFSQVVTEASAKSGRVASADERQARLLREGQALARLSHPNVIGVLDVGTSDDEVFIAMEFVEGPSLRAWLAEQKRSPREILEVFIRAGEGLAAAHRAGVVHRDFKPDNVLIGPEGRVRVTDFGLARPAEAIGDPERFRAEATETLHSQGNPTRLRTSFAGTPAYMAPEQLEGTIADARSDQYGFCVSLFEALYGTRPTRADLSGRAKELRHALPGAARIPFRVRQALLKGLFARPEQRHASMEALLKELARRPAATLGRAALAVAALALLLGGAVAYREVSLKRQLLCQGGERKLSGIWDDARRASIRQTFISTGVPYAEATLRSIEGVLTDYSQHWVAMHTEACEATRIRGEQSEDMLDRRMSCLSRRLIELQALTDTFQTADAALVQHAVEATAALTSVRICGDIDALRSVIALPTDVQLRSKVEAQRKALATIQSLIAVGRYAQALELAKPAVASSRALEFRPLEAEALYQLGEALRWNRRFRDGVESLTEAVIAAESGRQDEVAARASSSLVFVLGAGLESFDRAMFWMQHASAALERLGGNDEIKIMLLNNAGSAYYGHHQADKALENYQEALKLAKYVFGTQHAVTAKAFNDVGSAQYQFHRIDEAKTNYTRALEIYERLLGSEHPLVAMVSNNLGYMLWRKGDAKGANDVWERGLRIHEKALDPLMMYSLSSLSQSFAELGDDRKAVDYSFRALNLALHSQEPDSYVADFRRRYGDALAAAGRLHEALLQHQQALVVMEKKWGREVSDDAILTGIGKDWLGLGRPQRAIEPLERAVRSLSAEPNSGEDITLAKARFLLAQVLWETGKNKARSHRLAQEARETWMKTGPSPSMGQRKVIEIDAWLDAHRLPARG